MLPKFWVWIRTVCAEFVPEQIGQSDPNSNFGLFTGSEFSWELRVVFGRAQFPSVQYQSQSAYYQILGTGERTDSSASARLSPVLLSSPFLRAPHQINLKSTYQRRAKIGNRIKRDRIKMEDKGLHNAKEKRLKRKEVAAPFFLIISPLIVCFC